MKKADKRARDRAKREQFEAEMRESGLRAQRADQAKRRGEAEEAKRKSAERLRLKQAVENNKKFSKVAAGVGASEDHGDLRK